MVFRIQCTPLRGPHGLGFSSSGLGWGISTLRTQIVLMQAVFPTCFEKLRFIGLTEIWLLSDRRKTMTITTKMSFLQGLQFRATSQFKLLDHTLPRLCDCFRTEVQNRSVMQNYADLCRALVIWLLQICGESIGARGRDPPASNPPTSHPSLWATRVPHSIQSGQSDAPGGNLNLQGMKQVLNVLESLVKWGLWWWIRVCDGGR